MAMRGLIITFGVVLHALGAGCTTQGLSALLPAPGPASTEPTSTGPDKTGSVAAPPGSYETAAIVSGTPTEIYTLVARGVLGCWFGAGGPLKASHVFQAEAQPPAKGGAAEIVIHERDTSYRDRRGVRAYRVSFASEATGVRVGMTALKFEEKLAQAMAKDVESWAKGGSGCQLRALLPPPAPAKSKAVKGPAAADKAPAAAKKR
jgi:hypothetical protein